MFSAPRLRSEPAETAGSALLTLARIALGGLFEPRLDLARQLQRQRLTVPVDLLAERDADPAFGSAIFLHVLALDTFEANANPAFEQCLASQKHAARIRRGVVEANQLGITSTPYFLVGRTEGDGTKVRVVATLQGAMPFASFKEAVDRLAAGGEGPGRART